MIRGEGDMEVDPMNLFKVNRISEINLRTGHCVVDLEGVEGPVSGRITDPVLEIPDNVYTRSLNEHTGCTVEAKAVRKGGTLHRLYISNAK